MTGKSCKRFSVVDWCLLVVVLLGAFGIWYGIRQQRSISERVDVTYTIRISDADPLLLLPSDEGAFSVGDEVWSQNGTAALGRVIGIRHRPHHRAVVSDGKLLTTEVAGHADLDVTIRGTGTFAEGDGLRLSDVRISAGSGGAFRIGHCFIPYAVVIDVKKGGTEEDAPTLVESA